MIRTQTVRLYPTPKQAVILDEYLEVARLTYNWALDLKLLAWGNNKINLSEYDLAGYLTWLRSWNKQFKSCSQTIERDAIHRVDLAYTGFFRRLKQGKKPGFPRFKSKDRYRSMVATSTGQTITESGRIRVANIKQPIKCRGLQSIVGKIKQLRVLKKVNKWFAQLVIDDALPIPPKILVNSAIGIDVGLNHFAATTDGELIDNPRIYRRLERQLRRISQNVSRKVKGSSNRRKTVTKLQLVHEQITNTRKDFLHKLSREFVNCYDLIAVEDLDIAKMIKGRFAKSISDASWATFFNQLSYKAGSAGKTVMKVDPRGTTQLCSFCERVVPKDLTVRVHSCICGHVEDRDINAARNILFRAVLQSTHGRWAQACGEVVRLTESGAQAPDSLSKPLRSRNCSNADYIHHFDQHRHLPPC